MSWPTPQDYNEAVQNPHLAFTDLDLSIGQPELTPLGLPRPISGNFACVYKIQAGNERWAARCFVKEVPDLQQRYHAISEHLSKAKLPYTVPFTYNPSGIKVLGRPFPLLKMQWIQGESLNTFIGRSIGYPDTLLSTARFWVQMMADLKAANVAHGDLQHGNILVVGDELRLIDYDGMFVPALMGRQSNELGLPNYQLPSRSASDYGPYLDNFSAWVIYVSLVALAVHPELWNAHRGGDECLIFRKGDFVDPDASALLRDLNSSPHDGLRFLVDSFTSLFPLSPQDIPALDGRLPEIKVEPPRPWYSDFAEEPKLSEDKQRPVANRVADDVPTISDPGWIIDSLNEGKSIPMAKFQTRPKDFRIVMGGSLASVLLAQLIAAMPISEFLFVVSFVSGMSVLFCYIRYKNDPCHIELSNFRSEAKDVVRKVQEHQTLIDSISAERQVLQEDLAKTEQKLGEQKTQLSLQLQAEVVALQSSLNSRLQSISQRRQTLKTDETNKLSALQATLGGQISDLNQRIGSLNRQESNEKIRSLKTLQDSYVQSYLRGHRVVSSSIPGLSATFRARVAARFQTAADIDYITVKNAGIPGIGEQRARLLDSWRMGLESDARLSSPNLSPQNIASIETRFRNDRQTLETVRQQCQRELEAQTASARQYFANLGQSLNQEEQRLKSDNNVEKNRIQQDYSGRFATMDANVTRARNQVAAPINELTERLRQAQKQVFALRWKSEKLKKEGRRFASLRFRDYLKNIVSG